MREVQCRFSIQAIKEMEINHIPFKTGKGKSMAWICRVDESNNKIYIKRSTGKESWALDIEKLINVHDRIHRGELVLDQYVIDRVVPTFGTYIAGLLKHLGCS